MRTKVMLGKDCGLIKSRIANCD